MSGSKWNPNLPDLAEVETEKKEKMGGQENSTQAKASKWNKILPEVKASSVKGRGSIAKPGVSQVSRLEFVPLSSKILWNVVCEWFVSARGLPLHVKLTTES